MTITTSGRRQKDHYEAIHDDYESSYFDAESMQYRERFIYDPMFTGLDLNGCLVADLASGSGFNSLAVLRRFPNAKLTGYDISAPAVARYTEVVGSSAYQCDMQSRDGIAAPGVIYDAAIVIGGLHHCVADIRQTVENIHRMLRPGGTLVMFEPSSDFVLDRMRKLWYRVDKYFDASTECALCHDALADMARDLFKVRRVHYGGGLGYFLILNSLILRIPPPVKRMIAPALSRIDAIQGRLPGKALFPYFIAQWVKI